MIQHLFHEYCHTRSYGKCMNANEHSLFARTKFVLNRWRSFASQGFNNFLVNDGLVWIITLAQSQFLTDYFAVKLSNCPALVILVPDIITDYKSHVKYIDSVSRMLASWQWNKKNNCGHIYTNQMVTIWNGLGTVWIEAKNASRCSTRCTSRRRGGRPSDVRTVATPCKEWSTRARTLHTYFKSRSWWENKR